MERVTLGTQKTVTAKDTEQCLPKVIYEEHVAKVKNGHLVPPSQ